MLQFGGLVNNLMKQCLAAHPVNSGEKPFGDFLACTPSKLILGPLGPCKDLRGLLNIVNGAPGGT